MNVLVIGASSFVGAYQVEQLAHQQSYTHSEMSATKWVRHRHFDEN